MIEGPKVDTLLAGPLGGWLTEQTAMREAAKKQAENRLFKGLLVLVPPAVALWVFTPVPFDLKIWLTALPIGGIWWWSQAPKRKAVKAVKTGINAAIAASLRLTYECDIEPDAHFETAKTYGLVPNYDRATFEDRWSGTLSDLPFSLFECELKERRGSGKNTSWVTVFKGPILAFGYRRAFHGTTLVQRQGRHRKFFGGTKDSIAFEGHQLDHVDLVHPGFEDAFDVFSDDQVEARYLVHPVYVERLIALEEAFAGQNIRALFQAGQMIVAVENDNMFESGSIDARDDEARIAQTVAQFQKMAELAEALNEAPR